MSATRAGLRFLISRYPSELVLVVVLVLLLLLLLVLLVLLLLLLLTLLILVVVRHQCNSFPFDQLRGAGFFPPVAGLVWPAFSCFCMGISPFVPAFVPRSVFQRKQQEF